MELQRNKAEQEQKEGAIVIFDVDNTLYQGFTLLAFSKFLRDKTLILDPALDQITEDKRQYDDDEINYDTFAKNVVNHFYQALKDKPQSAVLEAGKEFLPGYLNDVMPFTQDLIEIMRSQGELYAVSGAPYEAFLPFAERFNMPSNNLFLLQGEVVDDKYTGNVRVNMALEDEKRKIVTNIIGSGFNSLTSFAFGDSKGDLPVLEIVDNRFILEPKPEMMEEIEKRGWNDSVVRRDNIISRVTQKIAEIRKLEA
ncbi:MAG: haloacid dehalogenase-like hydrolase [Candidatus Curtissbacteria bacterium]|nr:haloacid dehalogenase-like hydrolase [Candidatus Curtissbacteria bacterium]